MSEEKSIVVKIESDFKERVEGIFQGLGMSTSQAISIFLRQVELNRGLPFDVKLPSEPNELTRRVLKEPVEGLRRFASVEELFEDLNS